MRGTIVACCLVGMLPLIVDSTKLPIVHRMFVVGKDIPGKKVYVASGGDHPALLTHQALLGAPTWISREAADELRYHGFLKCSFKSR